MASSVDICNVALSHLGDSATVSAIEPPEGSAQAEHCARFYPIARDALLEMASWNFATKRGTLAELTNTSTEWLYAYAKPSGCINILAVHPADATDDYSSDSSTDYTPNPFTMEIKDSGDGIILTNVADAKARYVVSITDPAKFSPLFVLALSYLLASMLAGPLIKGDAGATASLRMLKMAQGFISQAAASDAGQREIAPAQKVDWITNR